MLRKVYKTLSESAPHPGKNTGPETKTEQNFIPIGVQVQRFIDAGELQKMYNKALYDIGWDEDFHMNNVTVHPQARKNLDRIDMQEERDGAIDRLKEAQERSKLEPDVTEPTEDTQVPDEETETTETK